MVFLFYNKWLLRALVVLIGVGIAISSFYYVSLLAEKLPEHGARDALAIISFLIAGWLVMVIAEVLDHHYVRAFGCLCVGLGGYLSFPWVFRIDGPKLLELPDGPSGMKLVHTGFWAALLLAVVMLLLLIVRLVLDKLNYGRLPAAAVHADVSLGIAPPGAGRSPAEPELPPIPVDASPLSVGSAAPTPAQAIRTPAPVKRLIGIGGMYLGNEFALSPGEHSIGRENAAFELSDDKQASRTHARITVAADGMATLADLGSTNGTFVNDRRIDSIALAPGDVIRIGTSLFKVEA